MIIRDYAEAGQYPPEYAINKMVLAWDNYKANIPRLRVSFGSPMAFFKSPIWDDETLWPWVRAVPREKDRNVGISRDPIKAATEEDLVRINQWRSRNGLGPL